MTTKKGIYCIEGFWEQNNVQQQSSVYPLLDLLQRKQGTPFLHHRCGTEHEVRFMLERWARRKDMQRKYPIIYFATHGDKGELDFGERAIISLKDLEKLLVDSLPTTIFIFGSCSTMKMDKRQIRSLLSKTGALAALGYKEQVDWMESAAVELLLLGYLQDDVESLDTQGMERELSNAINSRKGKALFNSIGFRIEMNEKRLKRPRKNPVK